MNKYFVNLADQSGMTVKADGFYVYGGVLVFYLSGLKTTEDEFPDSTNVLAIPDGEWKLCYIAEQDETTQNVSE